MVAACIEGMERAFDRYSELNEWFKAVAASAIANGCEDIRWRSPNGSLIVQRYNEPQFKQIQTYAASGGNYHMLMIDTKGRSHVVDRYGEPKVSKHQSAIAANFTHTLDACMIQDGVNNTPEQVNVVTVHDCAYGQPGYMATHLVPHFRRAFYNVVTTPVLENLLEENNLLNEVQMIEKAEVDRSVCLESPYMFS